VFSSTKKKTLEYFTFEVKKKPIFELQEGTLDMFPKEFPIAPHFNPI
jgi:hypothetical protein